MKNKNNKRENTHPKMKTTWVSKRDVREVCFKKQANLNKGKGSKKERQKKPPPPKKKKKNLFQKGVDGQKAKKKDGILKGKTQGKQAKQTE